MTCSVIFKMYREQYFIKSEMTFVYVGVVVRKIVI